MCGKKNLDGHEINRRIDVKGCLKILGISMRISKQSKAMEAHSKLLYG